MLGLHYAHKHKHFIGISLLCWASLERVYMGYPYFIGLHYKGFIWDIPILIFAYVLFWGPTNGGFGIWWSWGVFLRGWGLYYRGLNNYLYYSGGYLL